MPTTAGAGTELRHGYTLTGRRGPRAAFPRRAVQREPAAATGQQRPGSRPAGTALATRLGGGTRRHPQPRTRPARPGPRRRHRGQPCRPAPPAPRARPRAANPTTPREDETVLSRKQAIIWVIQALTPTHLEVADWGPKGAVLIDRRTQEATREARPCPGS